jgi:hypothetical protein
MDQSEDMDGLDREGEYYSRRTTPTTRTKPNTSEKSRKSQRRTKTKRGHF